MTLTVRHSIHQGLAYSPLGLPSCAVDFLNLPGLQTVAPVASEDVRDAGPLQLMWTMRWSSMRRWKVGEVRQMGVSDLTSSRVLCYYLLKLVYGKLHDTLAERINTSPL